MSRLRDEFEPEILERRPWDDGLDAVRERAASDDRCAGCEDLGCATCGSVNQGTLQREVPVRRRSGGSRSSRKRRKGTGTAGRSPKGDVPRSVKRSARMTPPTWEAIERLGVNFSDVIELLAKFVDNGDETLLELCLCVREPAMVQLGVETDAVLSDKIGDAR